MKRIFNIILAIGIAIGCLCLYFFYEAHQLQQQGIQTQGVVTDLIEKKNKKGNGGVWYPVVTFNDENGKQVVFKSDVGSSLYHDSLGEMVEVIYISGHAEDAKIDDNIGVYALVIISGIFSFVFVLIGGIGVILLKKGGGNIKLKYSGKPLQAEIVSIEQNHSIEINGRSPWRVICQWLDPQSKKVHIFKSVNIFYDPSPYINDKTITVYVAHDNFKKYYVDTSMLPEEE